MAKRFTESELDEFAAYYEEHGVVRLPGIIEPEWVEKVLSTIDDVSARAEEPAKPGTDLSFGRADGRMTIRYMWREIETIREFLSDQDLARPIARIIGTAQLRFWFDLTFIHHQSADGHAGAGTGWHHDIAAFAFKGLQLPSLWMAMTPADENRSRLMFIDRSHKTVPGYYRVPDAKPPEQGEKDGFLAIPDFDQLVAEGKEEILTWDCDPGDAIVIHPYTIHGAKGNTGKVAGRRVAITTRWLGDDVRFLPTPYTGKVNMPGFASADFALGAKPSGDYFPVVWQS